MYPAVGPYGMPRRNPEPLGLAGISIAAMDCEQLLGFPVVDLRNGLRGVLRAHDKASGRLHVQVDGAVNTIAVERSSLIVDLERALGTSVRLHGIKSRPELNGRRGCISSWDDDKHRFGVHMEGGEQLALRLGALRVVDVAPDPEKASPAAADVAVLPREPRASVIAGLGLSALAGVGPVPLSTTCTKSFVVTLNQEEKTVFDCFYNLGRDHMGSSHSDMRKPITC